MVTMCVSLIFTLLFESRVVTRIEIESNYTKVPYYMAQLLMNVSFCFIFVNLSSTRASLANVAVNKFG
jgi:hypothetical protein